LAIANNIHGFSFKAFIVRRELIMVESKQAPYNQNENANRMTTDEDYMGSVNKNKGTTVSGTENTDRMMNQPYGQKSGDSARTNVQVDTSTSVNAPKMPQSDVSPADKSMNPALGRALLGGLIGVTLGSLAGAIAGKKIGNGFNIATKGLGKAAKTIGEGLLQTGKGVGEAVKSVADGATEAVVGGTIDTVQGVAEGTLDAVGNTAQMAKQAVKASANAVHDTAEGLTDMAKQTVKAGANVIQDTAEGVSQAVKAVADTAQNTAEGVSQGVKAGADTVKDVASQDNQYQAKGQQKDEWGMQSADSTPTIYISAPEQTDRSMFDRANGESEILIVSVEGDSFD